MMPVGPILLMIILVLIASGFFGATIERMGLSRRGAVLLLTAMLAGSLAEIRPVDGLSTSLGGVLVPLGFAVWLLVRADTWVEKFRAVLGGMITAAAVCMLGRWFPPGIPTELNLFYLDAQYLFGLVGGTMGYLSGGSRRGAWVSAVLGVVLSDLAHYLGIFPGVPVGEVIAIGGGSFQGTAAVAGVLAVALAEWIGDPKPIFAGGHMSESGG